ncbi:hypothetical protein ACFOY2_46160 [Nonomuraea purpurea]|uniref:Uncharacterized protein n=1 Tax=Nonomuraea purpurea TaxID=1849276 RepID=A0ABV8GP22_9ACTN
MSITLPAALAPSTPGFRPFLDPACTTCGNTDVNLLEDLNGNAYTDCCPGNPVAWMCPVAYANVYLSPGGDEPEQCPHCPGCV